MRKVLLKYYQEQLHITAVLDLSNASNCPTYYSNAELAGRLDCKSSRVAAAAIDGLDMIAEREIRQWNNSRNVSAAAVEAAGELKAKMMNPSL